MHPLREAVGPWPRAMRCWGTVFVFAFAFERLRSRRAFHSPQTPEPTTAVATHFHSPSLLPAPLWTTSPLDDEHPPPTKKTPCPNDIQYIIRFMPTQRDSKWREIKTRAAKDLERISAHYFQFCRFEKEKRFVEGLLSDIPYTSSDLHLNR
eukprot:scaffold3789_cov44-Attheya_sp.AAC.1